MNYEMDFISGDTKKCLLAVSLPMMVAMFLNMAYNLVDSLWIGNLMGETAYAALTNSTPLILILNSIAMGATNGISILLSQAVGAKDKKNVESIVMTSFLSSVILAVSIMVLLELLLRPILLLLQTPQETYQWHMITCQFIFLDILLFICIVTLRQFFAVLGTLHFRLLLC